MVEVAIRNNGQLAITVPRDSEQLVSVSSITAEELARHGHDLTQEAVGWKEPDAYFASANVLLDDGEPLSGDLVLGPGDVLDATRNRSGYGDFPTTASCRPATWSSARGTCSPSAPCSPCRAGITPPRTWLC